MPGSASGHIWAKVGSYTDSSIPRSSGHNRPMRNQLKVKETLTGHVQYLKDFKYVLFQILAQ